MSNALRKGRGQILIFLAFKTKIGNLVGGPKVSNQTKFFLFEVPFFRWKNAAFLVEVLKFGPAKPIYFQLNSASESSYLLFESSNNSNFQFLILTYFPILIFAISNIHLHSSHWIFIIFIFQLFSLFLLLSPQAPFFILFIFHYFSPFLIFTLNSNYFVLFFLELLFLIFQCLDLIWLIQFYDFLD